MTGAYSDRQNRVRSADVEFDNAITDARAQRKMMAEKAQVVHDAGVPALAAQLAEHLDRIEAIYRQAVLDASARYDAIVLGEGDPPRAPEVPESYASEVQRRLIADGVIAATS